jgi:hypothetical protein
MAWVLGRAGLLLVPIGALWLWAFTRYAPGSRPLAWVARVTLGASVLVSLVMILAAMAFSGPLLSLGTAVIAGLIAVGLSRRLRVGLLIPRVAAAAMIVAPIVVLGAQSVLTAPITSWGRDRVIANAAPLIAEIERYHARHGAYPVSLFSLYGDYKPAIMGVQRYYYEPSADAYNVIFEEPALGIGRRFVAYNPRDKQRITVHETDRLLLDEAGLDADNAGYTIVQPLPPPHWKLFTFRS